MEAIASRLEAIASSLHTLDPSPDPSPGLTIGTQLKRDLPAGSACGVLARKGGGSTVPSSFWPRK